MKFPRIISGSPRGEKKRFMIFYGALLYVCIAKSQALKAWLFETVKNDSLCAEDGAAGVHEEARPAS